MARVCIRQQGALLLGLPKSERGVAEFGYEVKGQTGFRVGNRSGTKSHFGNIPGKQAARRFLKQVTNSSPRLSPGVLSFCRLVYPFCGQRSFKFHLLNFYFKIFNLTLFSIYISLLNSPVFYIVLFKNPTVCIY